MAKQIIHYKQQKKINIPHRKNKQTQETSTEKLTDNNQKKILLAFLAMLITFAIYLPTFKNSYTNWDDGHYIIDNHLIKKLDWSTIKKYFFSDKSYERYYMGNYHPLTMITYNLNYKMAKKNQNGIPAPFWFQFTNIFLHLISVFMVFLIIYKLLKNNIIAFLTALFFGIGTMHVESVAWISERKDVLYTVFYLIALYLYILYIERKKNTFYFLSILSFLLSLLSKGQAVSLAFSILLIDFWYNRKLINSKIILEKIPYFILALIFGLIAIEAQKYSSALQNKYNYELYKRIAIAAYGFTMYILKLIIPFKLSAIYPYPDILNKTIPFYYWLMLIPTVIILFFAYLAYKKNLKIITWSITFFVFNIIFLLQIIPVGGAIYADRYSYIPSIGIHLIVAWSLYQLLSKKQKTKKVLTIVLTIAYTVFIAYSTIQRIKVWHDSKTLWEDTTKKYPNAVVAWNNLGSQLNKEAKQILENQNDKQKYLQLKQQAVECFTKAVKIKPDYKNAFYNLGATLFEIAKITNDTIKAIQAIDNFNKAIGFDPTFIDAIRERGTVYDWLKKYQNAIADYSLAIKLAPNDPKNYINRAATFGKIAEYKKAIEDLNKALELKKDIPEIYSNLGLAYFYLGDYQKALDAFQNATKLEKDNPATYFNRSLVYGAMKKYKLALQDINKAIDLGHQQPDALYFKGYYLILLGNKKNGCQNLELAAKQNYIYAVNALKKFCNK